MITEAEPQNSQSLNNSYYINLYNRNNMPSVLKMMQTPLSDSDIKKILGEDQKLMVYSELAKYTRIRELLADDRDYVVILYEQKTPLKGGIKLFYNTILFN
jgi:hypothetical protein